MFGRPGRAQTVLHQTSSDRAAADVVVVPPHGVVPNNGQRDHQDQYNGLHYCIIVEANYARPSLMQKGMKY
jgi:hypothetical protein